MTIQFCNDITADFSSFECVRERQSVCLCVCVRVDFIPVYDGHQRSTAVGVVENASAPLAPIPPEPRFPSLIRASYLLASFTKFVLEYQEVWYLLVPLGLVVMI